MTFGVFFRAGVMGLLEVLGVLVDQRNGLVCGVWISVF